jgi:hypothetical protein
MTMDHPSSDTPGAAASGKKSYEKPGFRYEEVFVTSALSCTKAINESSCMFSGQKSS